MKALMIAFLMLATATQAQAMSAEACTIYADLSTAAFGLRLEGVPKRKVMEQNEFSGVKSTMFELAVIRAFTADLAMEPDQFRATIFRNCRAGEL